MNLLQFPGAKWLWTGNSLLCLILLFSSTKVNILWKVIKECLRNHRKFYRWKYNKTQFYLNI